MGRSFDDSYDLDWEEDHCVGVFRSKMSLGYGERKVKLLVCEGVSFIGDLSPHT